MFIFLKRHKIASLFSPTTSVILGALVGCSILFSQSRLGFKFHPVLPITTGSGLTQIVLGIAGVLIFALCLPLLIRRMTAIAHASKNELRYIAAAESSPDAVLMYDCIRSRKGEILDFKFTFLNGNAELM